MENETERSEGEAQTEKAQVEAAFGLGGGELSDKPVTYTYLHEFDGKKEGVFRYTYDGPPEYAARDAFGLTRGSLSSETHDYFTAILDCTWGLPPEEITIDGRLYLRQNHYQSSGETECPCVGCDEDPYDGRGCPLCDREVGEEHGYIYLGEGWCEVVYAHDKIDHMRKIAKAHSIQVWESYVRECDSCGDQFSQNVPHCLRPYCDAMLPWIDDSKAWFWQTCLPGCMPDSSESGPFDTEIEALEDATEGIE